MLIAMLLNAIEKAMMNNPARAALQRRFEARRLLAMGGRVTGGTALEMGCGRGVGTEVVLDVFGAARVDAFDLDPDMVALARQRLAGRPARVSVGDAERIDAPDATYDAVFDFAIVHHIPDWRAALREVHRVLKPGGRFYAEEVLARFIHHPLWRRVLDHPTDDRFDAAGFARGLEQAGLRVTARRELLGSFAWFVAEKPLAA
ncbi:MAG TPA: methyltransferase domain-containing protein [Polyangiaceae bacterium]|jgi:ubiquinone/menaquinone biosynthesis C-methylase UbiE